MRQHTGPRRAQVKLRRWPGLMLVTCAGAAVQAQSLPPATAEAAAEPTAREWLFEARLDGQPIGEHRFRVEGPAAARRVTSDARFAVRFLGFTAYRYRHAAQERWRGDCVARLQSDTDEDGQLQTVRWDSPPNCTLSFAYWNPALRNAALTELLNAQTGKLEPVRISVQGSGTIEVRGTRQSATRWRIMAASQEIDVWYAEGSGDWIGLDATVSGGRRLAYRLK